MATNTNKHNFSYATGFNIGQMDFVVGAHPEQSLRTDWNEFVSEVSLESYEDWIEYKTGYLETNPKQY